MLLMAVGLPPDSPHQAEARQICKMCNCLPLAISITGSMLKEHVSDSDDESVRWVLTHMEEELGPGGQGKSAEESVLATSLSAIRGPSRDSILALFGCLALCPEDTSPPLEVIRIMFEAVQNGAGSGAEARPTLLNIRRWLKVLINQGSCFSRVEACVAPDNPSPTAAETPPVTRNFLAFPRKQLGRN